MSLQSSSSIFSGGAINTGSEIKQDVPMTVNIHKQLPAEAAIVVLSETRALSHQVLLCQNSSLLLYHFISKL